jgi:prepilin-type N-terminal cleavage/methylation domain-containing protein
MLKKAFSLIELLVAVTLIGVMAILSFSYLNVATLSKQNIKTEFQSHLNIITATILQCKDLSNSMPTQALEVPANNTFLNTLVCNTTPTYSLDGSHGAFIPKPMLNFTAYKATQIGNIFYFTTTTPLNSSNYEVLQDLQNIYSANQYELTNDGTTATLNFYLSR